MDLASLKESLAATQPPAQASVYLQALWHDAKGNWQKAHELIQDLPDKQAAWIHAYLHRKEGDLNNAHFWYRRSGQPEFLGELSQEWEQITSVLLRKVNATHEC